MYEMKNWYIILYHKKSYLQGEVYDNPAFTDGTLVRTSYIVDIVDHDTYKEVVTKNHSYIIRPETVNKVYAEQYPHAYERAEIWAGVHKTPVTDFDSLMNGCWD